MTRSTSPGVRLIVGLRAPFAQTVQAEDAVGIDHHLHHQRVGQGLRDGRPHRCPQHGGAAVTAFVGIICAGQRNVLCESEDTQHWL